MPLQMAASKSSGERAEQFAAAGEQQISGEQLRHLEKLAKERQQERFWSDFQAAQNDLTVADKMYGSMNVGQRRSVSRKAYERAERNKSKVRKSFWEEKAEAEAKQEAKKAQNQGPAEDDEGDLAVQKKRAMGHVFYSFDARKPRAEVEDARRADLQAALAFCQYQFARCSDARILAGSIHRAENCLGACMRSRKRMWGEGGDEQRLKDASESIEKFKTALQRLKDCTDQQQGSTWIGPSADSTPRPSTPPLKREVSESWKHPPRPRTPPLHVESAAELFPPYRKPPDAVEERARNAAIWRLKKVEVPQEMQKQLQEDLLQKMRLEKLAMEQDYRTVDALPRDDLQYTM